MLEHEKSPPVKAGSSERAVSLNTYFGTLKIAIRLPPMFIVSINDPTKTFLLFLFINRQGPLVIRSPRVARTPSYVIVVFFAFFAICAFSYALIMISI